MEHRSGAPFFIRGDARAEGSRNREVHQLVAPCFLYVVLHMLKVIEAESYID
jgi:hypothetical protein